MLKTFPRYVHGKTQMIITVHLEIHIHWQENMLTRIDTTIKYVYDDPCVVSKWPYSSYILFTQVDYHLTCPGILFNHKFQILLTQHCHCYNCKESRQLLFLLNCGQWHSDLKVCVFKCACRQRILFAKNKIMKRVFS